MVKLTNLTHKYGQKTVIKDLNFTFPEKGIVTLTGPSGCGKTTLLRLIAGLEHPSGGCLDVRCQGLSVAFQEPRLLPWLSAEENINFVLSKDKRSSVFTSQLFEAFALSAHKKALPEALSGGMRQRISLMRALAVGADLLLLDEPFSALDYQTRLNVCDDVYKIIRSENKTAVLITHDISEAVSVADRVAVLSRRPARLVSMHQLDFDNEEPLKRRENPKFTAWFERLWRELNV